MSKKIVIMKPGFDASDTDPRHQRFNSDLESLMYFTSGSITVSGGDGDTQDEITHGLGYTPFFVAYGGEIVPSGGEYSQVPVVFADGLNFFVGSVWADSNKLYFRIVHDLGITVNFTFYYKIFRNSTGL